ncbi:DUF4199 domain-containing protein [Epilithonimonas hispanica]|uniref:DUF4199 domain-containing protein n=1 Tax=Epilithonimonas hispanica TaxID=358687 RepID=A0A3D9D181_9FLAO|nr:DUF4199 domain-containing protein [Epilithonimonas hispanica]REC71724.1 DUF4199 domain-containing protein [Epilithonimonas hispanica]
MTKNPIAFGFGLYAITMFLFFVVYYFFAGPDYFNISINVNAFGLTFIYSLMGFLSVYYLRKNIGEITYPQAFKQIFVTLFVGGFLSFMSIFLFLNYVDTDARDMLNHQHIESELTKLDESYNKQIKEINPKDTEKIKSLNDEYKKMSIGINGAKKQNINYFSFSFLSAIFGGVLLFYLLLSIVIAGFLKNKKRYE